MTTTHDDRADDVPRILPVFPLPNTVFFPGTSLPLHIFEPRYRAMVRDVTAGEGLIVVSLMAGDDFCDLGTVGRIREVEALEDGRFNIRLEGLERVSLAEVPGDTPYRQVRVVSRPEHMGTDDSVRLAEARLEVLADFGALCNLVGGGETLVPHQEQPFEVVVNTACAGLPIDPSLRQQLLAQDSLLARHRIASEHLSAVIDVISRLGAARDGGTLIN